MQSIGQRNDIRHKTCSIPKHINPIERAQTKERTLVGKGDIRTGSRGDAKGRGMQEQKERKRVPEGLS